jgi:hypothetical protein
VSTTLGLIVVGACCCRGEWTHQNFSLGDVGAPTILNGLFASVIADGRVQLFSCGDATEETLLVTTI